MKILIAGASGLVGDYLIKELFKIGQIDINILTRDPKSFKHQLPVKAFKWEPSKSIIDPKCFDSVDAIINLAGASIDQRWDKKSKQQILNSRVDSTSLLMSHAKKIKRKIKFLNASAIGYYGDSKETKTEQSAHGKGFMAHVCNKWEIAAQNNSADNIELQIVRIGVVLSQKGGMIKKLIPVFNSNLGAPLGDGKQFLSWIHIHDLSQIFIGMLTGKISNPIINAVSPSPVTNREFTKAFANSINKWTLPAVPSIVLKTMLGEMSEIILSSQKIEPKALTNNNFVFKYSRIKDALEDLLLNTKNRDKSLEKLQWLSRPKAEVFEFFKEASNLESITPKELEFKIIGMNTEKIQKDSIIDYKIKIHGFPVKWRTHIKEFSAPNEFVDQQVKGPYKKWHHQHKFYENEHGTLMVDKIEYKIPMATFGDLFLGAFIKKDLHKIFDYRFNVIKKVFNETY